MRESGLQVQVQDLCDKLALLWHHCTDSRLCTGDKGFPDLLIFGPSMFIGAELKSWTGSMSHEQVVWKYALECQGTPFYCWSPADLISGAIEHILVILAE